MIKKINILIVTMFGIGNSKYAPGTSDYHMFSIPLNVSINSGLNWGEAH